MKTNTRKPHKNQIRCFDCGNWVPTLVTGRCPHCAIRDLDRTSFCRGVQVRTLCKCLSRSGVEIPKGQLLLAVEDIIDCYLPVLYQDRFEFVFVSDVARDESKSKQSKPKKKPRPAARVAKRR